MKTKWTVWTVWTAIVMTMVMGMLSGCASTGVQPAPTKFDQLLLNATPTVTTITNYVTQTNVVTQMVTTTNTLNQVVTTTNVVPQTVIVPQVVTQTNWVYAPKPEITSTASTVGSLAGPWGTVAATALTGVLGLFAFFKNQQANTAQTVAGAGQQAIATAKAVIAAMPNGAALAGAFNNYLTAHQSDADIAAEVAKIVDEVVDPHATTGAALSILTAAAAPITLPPAAPVVAKV